MAERPVAVITGASSGIGAEFARQLAARGYDLLLVARREEKLRSVAEEIAVKHGVDASVMAIDLASEDGRKRLAGWIRGKPEFAMLVNNAGFGTMGFFTEVDLESQQRMHQLHVLATMELSRAALDNLTAREKTRGRGANRGVINVASVASFGQSPSNVSYCATKAWMASFTNGLATELGMRGSPIKVQALCPGFTYSEFHDVMGMDRGPVPKSLWLDADFVVRESLRGFDRGRVYVIPDWRYRLLVALMNAVPASWMRWASIRIAYRRRKNRGQVQPRQ